MDTYSNEETLLDDLIKKNPELDRLFKTPGTIIHMDFKQLQEIINKY